MSTPGGVCAGQGHKSTPDSQTVRADTPHGLTRLRRARAAATTNAAKSATNARSALPITRNPSSADSPAGDPDPDGPRTREVAPPPGVRQDPVVPLLRHSTQQCSVGLLHATPT